MPVTAKASAICSLFQPVLEEFHNHVVGTANVSCEGTIHHTTAPRGLFLHIDTFVQEDLKHIVLSLHRCNMNWIHAFSLEKATTPTCRVWVSLFEAIGAKEAPQAHPPDHALMPGCIPALDGEATLEGARCVWDVP